MTRKELADKMFSVRNNLAGIFHSLDVAEIEQGDEMVDPAVSALVTEFDDATNKIATRIQNLINNGTLNPESKAALQAEVDKLTLLGQDPNNPVPAEVK